ncbi:helix-turn-helix domain-containing protein [Actinopolymorpha sp. B17G11]|uniref:TetR/AcrR family transcriptional regulator n=1 Tax=Actinopolymorpha sp. B17G11 TaxID=3160861 RepID=UPI0032E4F96F
MSAPHGSVATVRREQILDSALRCFARYGYRRTSMDTIARTARMSRPALYQYFTGKEEVFRAMGVRLLDSALTGAERARRSAAPVGERLSAILMVRLDLVGQLGGDNEAHRELLAETASVAGDLMASFHLRLVAIVEDLLATATEELDFDAVGITAHDVAVILLDAVTGIERESAAADVRQSRVRQLVELVVRALSTNR